MIDLTTNYLGLTLKSPLVCSSGPLCGDVGRICALEDAGAAAVILPSLFEEQLELEGLDLDRWLSEGTDTFAESLNYFPDLTRYNLGPEGYLDLIHRVKQRVQIPVIASLNGVTPGGWISHALAIQEAGADALELNVYQIPTNTAVTGAEVEQMQVRLVREVKKSLRIPVAVKVGPFYSALASFATELAGAGADGLVLFNRFYQPDIDLETYTVVPNLQLSNSAELLLRLHWVAILYNQVDLDLAVTGGIHTGTDVIKALMTGARVTMMTSALLKRGISHLTTLQHELLRWLTEHEYESVRQMQGCMSMRSVANPAAFERGNYMKVLRSYALRDQV
jgi:dihydroorotate dehydrogenase (fumarate)